MNPDAIAELILKGLMRQSFYDFHNDGLFALYIDGDPQKPITREEILKEIKHIFRIE
jgi:hypothetical protein